MQTKQRRTVMRITLHACCSKQSKKERRRQRDVLRDVMLSATECDAWLTLDELAKLTQYPPASISAQLRHLRKPQFGGFAVEKRPRLLGRILRGEDFGTVWEYQLRREMRRVVTAQRSSRHSPRSAAASVC